MRSAYSISGLRRAMREVWTSSTACVQGHLQRLGEAGGHVMHDWKPAQASGFKKKHSQGSNMVLSVTPYLVLSLIPLPCRAMPSNPPIAAPNSTTTARQSSLTWRSRSRRTLLSTHPTQPCHHQPTQSQQRPQHHPSVPPHLNRPLPLSFTTAARLRLNAPRRAPHSLLLSHHT